MAIFYQGDAGLGQGIQNLGSILGNALMQSGQQKQQLAMQQLLPLLQKQRESQIQSGYTNLIERALQESGGDQKSALETALQQGVPLSFVEQYRKTFSPTTQEIEEKNRNQLFKNYSDTIKDMRDLLKYTGSKVIPGKSFFPALNRESLQKRSEFDNLAYSLEGIVREISKLKGTISEKVFNKMLEQLPSSEFSDRKNIGKMDALTKTIERHLLAKKESEKSPTPNRFFKVPKGTALNDEIGKQISERFGNDPNRHKEMEDFARSLGYSL